MQVLVKGNVRYNTFKNNDNNSHFTHLYTEIKKNVRKSQFRERLTLSV